MYNIYFKYLNFRLFILQIGIKFTFQFTISVFNALLSVLFAEIIWFVTVQARSSCVNGYCIVQFNTSSLHVCPAHNTLSFPNQLHFPVTVPLLQSSFLISCWSFFYQLYQHYYPSPSSFVFRTPFFVMSVLFLSRLVHLKPSLLPSHTV
jgi:hypothetical protein